MKRILKMLAYVSLLTLITGYVLLPPQKENYNLKYGYEWENYIPAIAYNLNNVDDVISYADSAMGKDKRRSLNYVRLVSRTVSNCFYHGYSYYSFHHNWMAYLAGKFIWSDLDAIVIPNDILKHPEAACSQVSIVLAECLKKIGVSYRKVGLKGHFALEAGVDGKWYFFDPNLEPHFAHGRKSLDDLIKSNELFEGYKGKLPPQEFKVVFSNISYGKPNAPLAPNATFFHRATFFLSILIALFLLIYVAIDLFKMLYAKLIWRRKSQLITVAIPADLIDDKSALCGQHTGNRQVP